LLVVVSFFLVAISRFPFLVKDKNSRADKRDHYATLIRKYDKVFYCSSPS